MGHAHGPSGAHTHGSRRGGRAPVIAGAISGVVLVALAAELGHLVLIVGGVILGLALVGTGALVAWRLRGSRANSIPPVSFHAPLAQWRAQALPAPQPPRRDAASEALWARVAELEACLARAPIEPPAQHHHLHLHGLTAEQAAAIVRQARAVYGTRNEHPAIEED